MKTIRLSLFNKFAIVAILVVIGFGVTNLYFLWNSAYKSFENEIDKRSNVLSAIIAERVLQPIVYHDHVNIYKELDEIKSNDPTVAYIFVLDENNKILAQTYDLKIPYALIEANSIRNKKQQIKVIHAKNFKHKIIRDIAYPILDGELGTVRLGLIEESIRKELNIASRTLTLMVLTFLIIGLIGAFFFSFMITLPIKSISDKAQNLNLKDIGEEDFDTRPLKFRRFFGFYFSDELDILLAKFNEMVNRLKLNVRELESTRDSFIQAEKLASIGTLTAGISHEINNPLSGIKNCVHRIEKNPTDTDRNIVYISLMKEAIEKIENVVQPLLDYSRKPDMVKYEIDPDEVISKALLLTEYKIKKAGIKVKHKAVNNLRIISSMNLLEQVIVNLLFNAIDAINERKKEKTDFEGLVTIWVQENADSVFLNVKDNGIGINEEYQNKIFDPFFTSKQTGEGTGLGLYVSYNIIQELGGILSFSSIEDQGSTFVIELKK